ncbi:uncharacterized protein B0H18DRAFT_980980 [Fomitopsis serialis]|uniref:uncharacterized protein n=1 Tax=Fomitopsis serialis TaxID=139415 RepID=UPI002007E832|nr:uncharacterized protein B0H18DRAFT_980980 [Neoantrodia serialis]KAH9934320.1 hypothetical protein B0H18DRAFT_980980 [Neoantrodia serialis]
MRLYALYGCNRRILIFLCVYYVGVLTSETTIISMVARDAVFVSLPGPLQDLTGCLPSGIKPWAWTFWLPMLTFETLLLCLSLFRSAQLVIEDRRPKIIYVLLRDSVVYFGGVVLTIVANVVGWNVGGAGLFAAFFPLAMMAFSVLGSRLLLNMHDAVDPSNRVLLGTYAGDQSTNMAVGLPTHDTASIQFRGNSAVNSEAISDADIELSDF